MLIKYVSDILKYQLELLNLIQILKVLVQSEVDQLKLLIWYEWKINWKNVTPQREDVSLRQI